MTDTAQFTLTVPCRGCGKATLHVLTAFCTPCWQKLDEREQLEILRGCPKPGTDVL